MKRERCGWCTGDPLYIEYHDIEWGVPSHDDRHLFEMVTLEGAQAGLSWLTVLRKRHTYREAFEDFDAARVAKFTPHNVEALMLNAGIVRNRLKIESAVTNAQAFLRVQAELGSFDKLVWSFVGGITQVRRPNDVTQVPPKTLESDALSKELRRRGFRFVGSTICYAFMQACGLVNDHDSTCYKAPKTRSPSKS